MKNKSIIIYGIIVLILMGIFNYTIYNGVAFYNDKVVESQNTNTSNSNGIYRSYNNGFHHK